MWIPTVAGISNIVCIDFHSASRLSQFLLVGTLPAGITSNNYITECDNVRIVRIVLNLHDLIVDSKKVVLFEYE